jgi:hypothetical protein
MQFCLFVLFLTFISSLLDMKNEIEQVRAEAAASKLGCTGAHPMGSRWMPCAQHGQASGSAHSHH